MRPIEIILTKVLDCSRLDLYLNNFSFQDLSDNQRAVLREMLSAYIQGRPIQYILGDTEFMGLQFKVREGVFIPRPETEILVETAIDILGSQKSARPGKAKRAGEVRSQKILDVGTGSGCIAVSLAKFLSDCRVIAVDISDAALEVARENARRHNVADRIDLLKSDLFLGLDELLFDIIVSNPPYIPTQEMNNLPLPVQYEPRISLDAGTDGLDFYRRIIKDALHFLKASGFLIFEIGDGQAQGIKDIFEKVKAAFKVIDIIKDYNSIDRVIVAQKI